MAKSLLFNRLSLLNYKSEYSVFTPVAIYTGKYPYQKNLNNLSLFEVSHWQFKIFSLLWAIATLFHMGHSGIYDYKLVYAFLSLTATFVIFRPGNLIAFILLISFQLYDIIFLLPNVTNHWLFTGFVNLTILQALIYLFYKNKSFRVKQGELLKTFTPAIRVEVIILYFYAVFQKLNSGFFTPEVSCATELLHAQPLPSFIPLTPDLVALNAYFTLFIEGAIPLLLIFKKTRQWGILFGLVFHSILSYNAYNAYYDFSSMIFAAYFLFASPQFSYFVARQWAKIKRANPLSNFNSDFSSFKLFLYLGGLLGGMIVFHVLNKELFNFYIFHLYFFWTAYSLIFIFLFLRFLVGKKADNSETGSVSLWPHWSFLIIPAIVFLNGLSPYLGLKTENSYSMFSNLRTEGGISNHFIIPASFQIFDYQKDLVEIVSSTDPELQELANNNDLMVFFAFKEHLARVKPERVEYIRNGKPMIFELSKASANDELLTKNNIILRKLLWFRPISKLDPQPCRH